MASVLHVSVNERAVALTWRVTERPKKLKKAILHATTTPDQRTLGVSIIWCHPRGKSKKVDLAETAGIASMGMNAMTVMAPNKPSKPTAVRGATE